MEHVTTDGIRIPRLGFGTWQLSGRQARESVRLALEAGVRHVDTAAMYGNEVEVGQGVRDAGLAREDVFVTTKIWLDDIAAGRHLASVDASLERLELGVVDLLLLHWPVKGMEIAPQVAPLAEIRESGRARAVGVSNYTSAQLAEAVASAGVPIAANQCEYHPRLDQSAVLAACRAHGVLFTSYCPLGKGELLSDPVVAEVAGEAGRTPAQVILRWHLQQENVAAIPKSGTPEHIRANAAALDFALTGEQMARLSALARPDGRMVDFDWAPDWD